MERTKRSIAINNKARGKALERKTVITAQVKGLHAVRAWGSNGLALGLQPNVDVVIEKQAFQCKKTMKLRKDFNITDNLTGVIIEGDRTESVVLLRLSDYLDMLAKAKGVTFS